MLARQLFRFPLVVSVLVGLCVSVEAGIQYSITLLPDVGYSNYFYPVSLVNRMA
jgi:hypothetical protein